MYSPIADALDGKLIKAILGEKIIAEIGWEKLKQVTSVIDKGRSLGGMHLSTSVEREGIICAIEIAYSI